MRTVGLVILLFLCACSRKQAVGVSVEAERANANPAQASIPPNSPQRIGRTIKYLFAANALLVVHCAVPGDDYGRSLVLTTDGYLTYSQDGPMRQWEEFRRYYPDAEAERLFDSIIPLIEKHAITTATPPRNYYSVSFAYQTNDGAFIRECIIPDLEPITRLLAELESQGRLEAPVGHPPVQTWARKRFDLFLPPRSLLELDPMEALQIKTDFNRL